MSGKRTKKIKTGGNVIALIAIILGFLIVFNYISLRFFTRFDLTEEKEFTISKSTKEILKNLDDIVHLDVYFSKKLPAYMTTLEYQVKDILEEYKIYSQGNLNIEFIDPTDDPKLQQNLQLLGIPMVQVNIIEKDKAQIANIYLGMAVLYEDKKEIIPVVEDVKNLEYDLTSAILKVTSAEVKTVAILSKADAFDEYQKAFQLLEKQYKVIDVDLETEKEIPPEVTTLMVVAPKNIEDKEKYLIDQFIMRGGKAIFLVDAIQLSGMALQAIPIDSKLDDLLTNYGVKVNQDLVLDRYNVMASFSTGFMFFTTPYPFWVKIVQENFDKKHPIVSKLESLVLPWTSSIEILENKPEDIEAVVLAKSTEYSQTQQDYFNLDPTRMFFNPTGGTQRIVAVALSGEFPSLYADKEIPEGVETTVPTIKKSETTQLVVIGTSNFIANNFLSQYKANEVFFQNAVDWLSLGEELIGIRSRGVTDRPLKEISEQAKTFIRLANTFAVPLLLAIYGIIRVYLKRKTKKLAEVI